MEQLDYNRERRERYHEICASNVIAIFEGLDGDFLDIIFDSPDEMHELIEDGDISRLVRGLSVKQKDTLYLKAMQCYSIPQIAFVKQQSERNIRKLYALMQYNIQSNLAPLLRERIDNGLPLTPAQRGFLEWYNPTIKDKIKKAVQIIKKKPPK